MAGMKLPLIAEIAKNTYAINEFGMSTVYLLTGTKRALLIDTGTGVANLRETVESLTDLPCDVALTHSHMDHIGNAMQFPEVYLSEKDQAFLWKSLDEAAAKLPEFRTNLTPSEQEALRLQCLQTSCREYADLIGTMGAYDIYDYRPSDIPLFDHFPVFLDLEEGMSFDLGGRLVQVISTPGHTPGGRSFLDRQSRILFSGDACNPNLLLMFGCTVEKTLESLRHLETFSSEFDRNFNGHIGYAGDNVQRAVPDRVLSDAIEVCRQVTEHTARIQTERNFLNGQEVRTAVCGTVKISF